MSTAFVNLPVDAGMMSVIPVELYVSGKYSELDFDVEYMKTHPEVLVRESKAAAIFRIVDKCYVEFTVDTEDVVTRFFARNYKNIYKGSMTITYEPGLYILSDPCYILDDPEEERENGDYFKVCETLMPGFVKNKVTAYLTSAVTLIKDKPVFVCSSGYGDGLYPATVTINEDHQLRIEVNFVSEDDEENEE